MSASPPCGKTVHSSILKGHDVTNARAKVRPVGGMLSQAPLIGPRTFTQVTATSSPSDAREPRPDQVLPAVALHLPCRIWSAAEGLSRGASSGDLQDWMPL